MKVLAYLQCDKLILVGRQSAMRDWTERIAYVERVSTGDGFDVFVEFTTRSFWSNLVNSKFCTYAMVLVENCDSTERSSIRSQYKNTKMSRYEIKHMPAL